MEKTGIRDKALAAIDDVTWYPKTGRNRIYAMIENRPDWVVSRQRAWGVPLTVFVHRETGEILRDADVNARIVDAVRQKGADAWFDEDPQNFLGAAYAATDYERVTDILDVWFDSGVTHAFVLEARDDLQWPADVYLEGSDQHRGWFHSSCWKHVPHAVKRLTSRWSRMASPWMKRAGKCRNPSVIRSTRKKLSAIGCRDYPPVGDVVGL